MSSDHDDISNADFFTSDELHEMDQVDEAQQDAADTREPCGEGHCYGAGDEHYDHACGCDCPRDDDGQLLTDG